MANYLNGTWDIIGDGVSYTADRDGLHVSNAGSEAGSLRLVVQERPKQGWYTCELEGVIDRRAAGPTYLVNEYNYVLATLKLDSSILVNVGEAQSLAFFISVPPDCAFSVSKLTIKRISPFKKQVIKEFCDKTLHSRIAVLVPDYPSIVNQYPCAFVHARVKAYRDANLDVDVIRVHDGADYRSYSFEGVGVLDVPIANLGRLLSRHPYDAVLLHFFDETFAQAIDGNGLGRTQFILWSHNPETRYWEWPLFTTPYFEPLPELTDEQKALFEQRDRMIERFNAKPNVSWVFISELQKKRAEELIGIRFERAHVIPNLVDEKLFPYQPKDPALRTKVFCVRKFENIATYALDIDVACVLELSKRPCFASMEFDFYGDGPMFDTLLEPIAHFENVHLHKRFLTRGEIAAEHACHGIALFATRFDSQGVSMCEAAMSGLATVSSDIDAANYFLPNDRGLLCEVENPVAYADAIERLATDPDYFSACSQACHDKVYDLCRRKKTIGREIDLLNSMLEKRQARRTP